MNIKKLIAWNMSHPIEQRLHVETIIERTATFHARGNMVALMTSIHAEIEPALLAMRKAQDLLDRTTRTSNGVEKRGKNTDQSLRKYGERIATFRPCPQFSDLATENESVGACFLAGLDKGETTTRNVATCNL